MRITPQTPSQKYIQQLACQLIATVIQRVREGGWVKRHVMTHDGWQKWQNKWRETGASRLEGLKRFLSW